MRERASDPVIGGDPVSGAAAASLSVETGTRSSPQKGHPLDSPGFSFNPVAEPPGDQVEEVAPSVPPEIESELRAQTRDALDPEQLLTVDSAGPGTEHPDQDTLRPPPFSNSLMTSNSIFGAGGDPDYEG
jgi:hypothetical protein